VGTEETIAEVTLIKDGEDILMNQGQEIEDGVG
jgi:hypothetical protein